MHPFFILRGDWEMCEEAATLLCVKGGLRRTPVYTTNYDAAQKTSGLVFYNDKTSYTLGLRQMAITFQDNGCLYGIRSQDLVDTDVVVVPSDEDAVLMAFCIGAQRRSYIISIGEVATRLNNIQLKLDRPDELELLSFVLQRVREGGDA